MEPTILNQSGIYMIRNEAAGNGYVGSAVNLRRRWRDHRNLLSRGAHRSAILQAAWSKNGADAFAFEVVEFTCRSRLLEREQVWLDFFRPAYNIANVARAPMLGRKQSESTRAKIGQANKGRRTFGRIASAETRAKLSASLRGNKNCLGLKRSERELEKLRGNTRGLGHKHTAEARARMSANRTGKPHPVTLDQAKAQQRREQAVAAARARWS